MSITGSTSAGFLPGLFKSRRPTASLFIMRRAMLLTFALLVAVTVVAVLGLAGVIRNAPAPDRYVAWSACSMLVVMAIAVLLLGRDMTQRTLRELERQLGELTRNGHRLNIPTASVPEDLKPVMRALDVYVSHIRDQMGRLRLQKKELDIQNRVAAAERRHTEAMIFSISDAVLVIDPFGELVLANTAGERLFMFDLSECRHRPIDRVLQDRTLVDLIKDARAVGEHSVRRQVEYSTIREGVTQTFNITLATVIDAEGESRGVIAVFHDITREREIARIKTEFVSAVSHELRTPLSSIKAYVEMLVDGEAHDEATRREFYTIIEAETDRLQRLISNVLNISQIESGVMPINRETVCPNEAVRKVVDMLAPQADAKQIEIDIDLAAEPAPLWADKDLIHRAITNVVSNAIKYTPERGGVRIRTRVDDAASRLLIAVVDSGVGIHPSDLPNIFNKFYRARDSINIAKGTGLGLNLVKQIVETVHQGEISVTSEHGSGTTVVLRLPLMIR